MIHLVTILTFFKYALLIYISIGLETIIISPVKAGYDDDGLPYSSTISIQPAAALPNVTPQMEYSFECDDHNYPHDPQLYPYIPPTIEQLINNAKLTYQKSKIQDINSENAKKEINLLQREIDKGSKLVEKGIEECNKEIELWDKDQEDNQQGLCINTWTDQQVWDWDLTPTTSPSSSPSPDWDNSWDAGGPREQEKIAHTQRHTSLPLFKLATPLGDYSNVPVNKDTEEVAKPNIIRPLSVRVQPITIAPLSSPHNLDLVSPAGQNSKDIPQKKAADEDQGLEGLEAMPTTLIERPHTAHSPESSMLSIELPPLAIESNHGSRRNGSTSPHDNSPVMDESTINCPVSPESSCDSGYQEWEEPDKDNSSERNSPLALEESFMHLSQIQGLNDNFPEMEARTLAGPSNVISPLELVDRDAAGNRAKRNLSGDTIGQMPLLGAGRAILHPTPLIIEREALLIHEASSEQTTLVSSERENLGEERSGVVITPTLQERITPAPPLSQEISAEDPSPDSPITLEDDSLLPPPEWPASPSPLPTGTPGGGTPSPAHIIGPNYYFTDIVNIIRLFINNRFAGTTVFPTKTILSAGEENNNIQRGIWISGLYGFIKQGVVDNAAGYTGHSRGGNIGFDAEINNHLIGIAYSNIHSIFKCKTNQVKDRGITTSHVFSIYGQKNLYSNFAVQGLALISRSYVNNIAPSLLNNTQYHLTEKYRVTNYSLEALLNYQYPTKYNLILAPNIGLRYGFSLYDIHNNLSNLLNHSKSRNILTGIIGTKLSLPLKKITESISLGLILQGGIEYNFNPKTQQITRTISVGNFYPIQNYILSKPPKTTYNVGTSLFTHIKNLQISLEYRYHLYKRYYSHHGIMKFKVNF